MARINIDDGLESNDEFWRLLDKVGNRFICLGMLVAFFRLCQKRFGQNLPVTKEDLEINGLVLMIETGWAVKNESGFQALNAEKYFDWYRQIVRASALGVEAMRKKRESNKINEVTKPYGSIRLTGSNQADNPLALSPSLVPVKEENTLAQPAVSRECVLYDFDLIYQEFPRKEGKSRGLAKCRTQIKTQEDFDSLLVAIRNYKKQLAASAVEPRFIKHFSTFMGEWRDWLDPKTGTTEIKKESELSPMGKIIRERELAKQGETA